MGVRFITYSRKVTNGLQRLCPYSIGDAVIGVLLVGAKETCRMND